MYSTLCIRRRTHCLWLANSSLKADADFPKLPREQLHRVSMLLPNVTLLPVKRTATFLRHIVLQTRRSALSTEAIPSLRSIWLCGLILALLAHRRRTFPRHSPVRLRYVSSRRRILARLSAGTGSMIRNLEARLLGWRSLQPFTLLHLVHESPSPQLLLLALCAVGVDGLFRVVVAAAAGEDQNAPAVPCGADLGKSAWSREEEECGTYCVHCGE